MQQQLNRWTMRKAYLAPIKSQQPSQNPKHTTSYQDKFAYGKEDTLTTKARKSNNWKKPWLHQLLRF
jgi:hypothetical protein